MPLALTKAGPSVLALWSLARGEWRIVARAALSLVGVVAASAALAPDAWVRWVGFLLDSAGTSQGGSALLRLGPAAVVVVVAARLDRGVLLAPALILAVPIAHGLTPLAILLALPRLLARDHALRAGPTPPRTASEATGVARGRRRSTVGVGRRGGRAVT